MSIDLGGDPVEGTSNVSDDSMVLLFESLNILSGETLAGGLFFLYFLIIRGSTLDNGINKNIK